MAKKTGRPPLDPDDYTPEILNRMVDGESLRKICRDTHMPDASTVFKWLQERPEFAEQYARAQEARAEAMQEDIIDIADDAGTEAGEVQKAKLRSDNRKWIMARMNPRKYGDRLGIAHSGNIGIGQALEELDGGTTGLPSEDKDDGDD